ncbi:helix-turn-helix domain-containing protein [Raoultibacter timonensis]|uniref:HTH luxR-type domain-containing protein n=1 Tax=Raoultibacter timonensis TaxID=1907662 RepID=A0ABN6MHZ0_9ACTN|nr:LuxR C-terminal-related transcriptional regulator [Raoultibacter timonensis]BDE97641.1 hypothetical protein CE91St30_29740 [Raoultibacter timonensis]BDF52244.1 hypothetical protein CE91St31_29740 [Raoultibacter timonensis]
MQGNQAKTLLASAGFACFLAMNSFSLWGFTLLPQTTLGPDSFSLWSAPLSYGNALSFLVFVVGAYKLPCLFNRNPLTAATVLLALASILLNGFMVLESSPMLIAAGTCMGIGTTCSFFCWARTFFADGVDAAKTEIVLGSVLSAVPFLAFLTLDPSAIVFTLSVLAFLNLIALFAHGRMEKPKRTVPTAAEPFGRIVGSSWKSLLCIAMIGFMAPIVATLSHQPLDAMEFVQQTLMVHSENICAAIILGIAWLGLRRNVSSIKAFTILFPILTTVLLVFPFIGENARIIVPYVGGVAFVVFSVVLTIESISVSTERNVNLTVMYGLYAGLLYCANQIGTIVASGLGDDFLFEETSIMAVLFVLLYGCSIVMFFITRKSGRGGAEENVPPSATPAKIDTVDIACQALIKEKGFSERQGEVLLLLAHGFDIPTIAKKLYLSENTVRTHTKKLYAALDVHSKQEIIELVNAPRQ